MNDNVWFTYKARIQAHSRLEWLAFHSQLLLVWYALLASCLAVVTVRYPDALGVDTDIISATLAIGILAVSMVVASRDFRGRAVAMRQNYLELHRLYDGSRDHAAPLPADSDRYHALLAAVENHSDIDDKLFRTLNRRTLTSRKPSAAEMIEARAYLAIRCVVAVALYSAPLLVWFVL